MSDVLYLQSDNLLELKGLKNAASGAYINNATVTVTLVDASGTSVSGQSWPATLSYVSGSNGDYRLTLEDTLPLSENGTYVARVTAIGDGLKRYFEPRLVAQMGS